MAEGAEGQTAEGKIVSASELLDEIIRRKQQEVEAYRTLKSALTFPEAGSKEDMLLCAAIATMAIEREE